MQNARIAVVGGGVAGLSAAWLLSDAHRVTLFEANDYIGGHTNTVDVPTADGADMPIDTGFIVFNHKNYPHLTAMLDHLAVKTLASDMSFSFTCSGTGLEWAGDNLNTLFAQRRNLLRPRFWRMAADILRFNARSRRYLSQQPDDDRSMGDYLAAMGASSALRDHYLLPMAAAIWSCPQQEILGFPARRFLQFFNNHGLIDLSNRPLWRTVAGGAREYVRRMLPALSDACHVNTPVRQISREDDGVRLRGDRGELGVFDQVVIATHADQALSLLEAPHFWEATLLSNFNYQANDAWLHTDRRLMPRLRRTWSSWNYLANPADAPPAVTYWMNRLQRLGGDTDYFVTLNPQDPPAASQQLRRMRYDHPVFSQAAIRAQRMLHQIQGRDRVWYCGSYFGYGFHEDALRSAVDVASRLGAAIPWTVPGETEFLGVGPGERTPEADLQVS